MGNEYGLMSPDDIHLIECIGIWRWDYLNGASLIWEFWYLLIIICISEMSEISKQQLVIKKYKLYC